MIERERVADAVEAAALGTPGVVELLPIVGIHLGSLHVDVGTSEGAVSVTVRVRVDSSTPQGQIVEGLAARIKAAALAMLPIGTVVRVRVRVHAISGRG
ncbi:hypothetical protein C5B85_09370 [Pseudoclavibacter sp. AY1F1]|uniref:hypothetical protein n=1 Tax=Pseudoclavibacter sp. AY1F1 TaxID=2080583 RepID=UPI000CE7FD5E|nr:hypothetical protein [Pseudoclavibacter sp. AY1F1]PPF44933.1 hypothetical protein C5B85_09370 [Pseudoclavibacter sp. AY1F1]